MPYYDLANNHCKKNKERNKQIKQNQKKSASDDKSNKQKIRFVISFRKYVVNPTIFSFISFATEIHKILSIYQFMFAFLSSLISSFCLSSYLFLFCSNL